MTNPNTGFNHKDREHGYNTKYGGFCFNVYRNPGGDINESEWHELCKTIDKEIRNVIVRHRNES